MTRRLRPTWAIASIACLCALAAACTDKTAGNSATGQKISVTNRDDKCLIDPDRAPSGTLTFAITNKGTKVTEFYVLDKAGQAVRGEAENIGPGLSRNLVVSLKAGQYTLACVPGMSGKGNRIQFTVTANTTATTLSSHAELQNAVTTYTSFVREEVDALVTKTEEFARVYNAGQFDQARELYARARTPWERIEPVAESFGDLDPKLDLREADLAAGQKWTGWHVIEKDLWPPASGYTPLTATQRAAISAQLVADTKDLHTRVATLTLKPDQLGNGAKELLDEVSTGKVTGEEEAFSHTDLWDMDANVEGAKAAYEALRPVLLEKNPKLAATLDERFEAIEKLMATHRTAPEPNESFVLYTALTPAQVKELSDAAAALAEPLSELTAAVVA